MAELVYLQAKIEKQKNIILRQEKEELSLQKQLEDQRELFQKQRRQLEELQIYLHKMDEVPREQMEEKDKEINYQEWKKKSVLVVGGHINWQNKLKELFPEWQFISSDRKNITKEVVQGKKFIIFHTEVLTHACYYKIQASRVSDQKILYVHNNNLEMCLLELENQIKAS